MFEKNRVKNFQDLIVWQKGHQLVLSLYKISKEFPREELLGLTSQLRRAAVSFTSDIAEGFSRSSPKNKIRFYFMALGSLTEIQNQIFVARDLSYLKLEDSKFLFEKTVQLHKMTNGLIKSTRDFLNLNP